MQNFNYEVKKMTPVDILDIVEAFFAAVLRVLKALGIVKEDDTTGTTVPGTTAAGTEA